MAYIIDRRLNSKNKSTVNRQRFLKRYRKHIKDAVADTISKRSITDIDKGEKISIPKDDVNEPVFGHGPGGKRTIVNPGNKEFIKGDKFKRPQGGAGGSGSGEASDSGEGIDDFVFNISQEEMLNFMFEDLELPNLVKRQLAGTETFKFKHGGITTQGTPNNINVVRSMRSANARRIALGSKHKKRIKVIEAELEELRKMEPDNALLLKIDELETELELLKHKVERIPFIDDFDIKYNLRIKEPQPSSKAVMFCLMDTSGSMTQEIKDMAKRFYLLLYLFLKRNYKHIEVVFIRHHTSAKEVDEEDFFYSRETGGTIVSSALKLMNTIIEARYPVAEWNIYGAQASDGDNWRDDSRNCYTELTKNLLPKTQYFCYVEITERDHQSLWREYEKVQAEHRDSFSMRQIRQPRDIYPVFHELFSRKEGV